MDFSSLIQPGMIREDTYVVEEEHLASHIGSGEARVLATPWLIMFIERTSHRLIAQYLPAGFSSVGTVVELRHLAPTPLGGKALVRAEVTAVENGRVTLNIQAWDEVELIGTGTHQRFIIDEARFLKRIAAKSSAK